MTMQIRIEITHGNSSVQEDDLDRAEAAALEVLGNRDIEAVYREFQRQWDVFDSYDEMTGDAALWVEAEKAANVALTKGWHNPNGAGCGISL